MIQDEAMHNFIWCSMKLTKVYMLTYNEKLREYSAVFE